jgi:hypothetical protein
LVSARSIGELPARSEQSYNLALGRIALGQLDVLGRERGADIVDVEQRVKDWNDFVQLAVVLVAEPAADWNGVVGLRTADDQRGCRERERDTQRTWNMYEKGELSMMSVCDRSRPSRLRSCVAQWAVSERADNGARGGAP